MQGFVITSRGGEHICAHEIAELIGAENIVKEDTAVKFDISSYFELCTVCYRAQSIYRGILLLEEYDIDKSLHIAVKAIESSLPDFTPWLKKTFIVECQREGEHDFHSVDIAGKVAGLIIKQKKGVSTDFDNPDTIFYLYIRDKKAYLGVDFSGFELAKRQYKIFNHPESLKGVTGYILVRESGFNKKQILLDPFMGSGVIVIEAGLFASGLPVQYYNKDKLIFTKYDFFKKDFFKDEKTVAPENIYGYDSQLRYLKAAQKNAKIAGVKDINLSKAEVEWLDTKFEKGSVDFIVTDPPRVMDKRDNKKTMNEFFYQAAYILSKKGTIVMLGLNDDYKAIAQKHKFKIVKSYLLSQGKETFNVMVYASV